MQSSHKLRARAHHFKVYVAAHGTPSLDAASLKPRLQVLALTDIENAELVTSLEYTVNTHASDSHAATYSQLLQRREMEPKRT